MPKATLTFKLPEEYEEFEHAIAGADAHIVLFQTLEMLRGKLKHGQLSPKVVEELEFVREYILNYVNDYNLKL